MRDDLASPNLGSAPKEYNATFFNRALKGLELVIARFLSKGPVQITELTVDDITVTDDVTIAGDLAVTGTSTLTGAVTTGGNASVGGNLSVTGTSTLTGAATMVDLTASGQVRLTDETDVSLVSTDHAFQIGPDAAVNLAMDGNEIMARNNGATSTLFLNAQGGLTQAGGDLTTLGNLSAVAGTFTDFVSVTRATTPQLQLTRTASTINTNIQLTNDSGSVYIGHGPVNTFAAGNNSNLSSAANQFFAASSSGISVLGGTAVNALAAGTYVPTITNVTNVDSTTPQTSHYLRVGNEVMVFGSAVIDATAAASTLTTIGISLPIASNLALAADLHGLIGSQGGTNGRVIGNVAGDRADAHYLSASASASTFYFNFMYTVI